MESKTELAAGVPLTMDFGPDKTDAQLLLDYGVLDDDNPKVSQIAQIVPIMSVIACYMVMTHGQPHTGTGQQLCPLYNVLTPADCTQTRCTQVQHSFGCDACCHCSQHASAMYNINSNINL